MKPLKLGIIGAGHIFWYSHQKNLARMNGVEIVAVCDPNKETQSRVTKELGANVYDDIDSMLGSESGLDALLNFSPPFVRKAAIQAAIKLGVPIFIEKPVAGTVREAMEIQQLLDASPVPVSVGFMFRYMPAVNRCLELLEDKQITHVNSEFFCPAISQWGIADWFFKKEVSGGPIVDQAIHLFDLIRFLAGDVEQVMSFGANVIRQTDDTFTIEDSSSTILSFANGAVGSHNHSWVHDNYGTSLTVRTEKDFLTIDLVDNALSGAVDGEAIEFKMSEEEASINDHYRELDVFLEATRSGDFSGVRSNFADGTRSLAVAEAVNKSMESNAVVQLKEEA